MKRYIPTLFFVLLFGAVCFQTAFGQEADHQKLIKASRFLEQDPLGKDAKAIRSWAFVWAADTKDVTVIICGLAGPFLDKKVKFGNELMSQYTIAMTAYKLEHPDKLTDENAAQLAGVESALTVYEFLLNNNPKGKTPAIDDLLSKRDKGDLAAFVAAADCGKK
ncbi:MAG: hypothetical protein ABJA02_15650 [Acidobacteriota bacterium]